MSRSLHLYTLARMLAEPDHTFRVADDLEVYDRNGRLLEAVYVDAADFYARARQRLKEHPEAKQRFVSFEPLPRVLQAIPSAAGGLDGEARATLERAGLSRKQIDAFRDVFLLEQTDLSEDAAFPHLSAWLSQERGRISAVDVRERLKALERTAGMPELDAARELAANGIPVTLRIDVAPHDLGWAARVDELRSIRGARVHVTIDEEYWRRAERSGATLLWDNVVAEFREARPRADDERDWEALVIEGGDVASLQPKTWSGAAGILRGLLWRDVQHYHEANADLIADVRNATRAPELAWAVLDPAGLGLIDVGELFPDIAARRPAEAFVQARAWLGAQAQEWSEPASEQDWRGVAEIAYWSKRWNVAARVPDAIPAADIPLDVIADVVYASGGLREHAIARFQRETLTASITETDEQATAHWVAPLDADVDLHRETIRRLDLLRRLYPEHRTYGAHVYGNVSAEMKRNVPAEQFPVPWLLRAHLMFSRPELTWDEYAASVASLRTRIASLFGRITAALTTWFRRDKPFTIFESGVDAAEWDAIAAALASLPKVPRSAVDEWGIEVEGAARAWSAGTPHAH
ncbi:MAG TPA: hypothetical protein VE010_18630, partial [Thermoanaerobaculia bacterium]|nr:hypothetical protein [Thermoanaerobaculia bacterium]